jgi:PAS domain S-box-containing protein
MMASALTLSYRTLPTPQFPGEWVKGALVLALVSSWAMVALFAYLNRRTRKPYLSLWTVAWMFYSVYLAASFSLEEVGAVPLLVLVRRVCIGISALFLFWGSLQRTNQRRSLRELGWAVGLIVLWNYLGVMVLRDRFWLAVPMFGLLAAAGGYSALPYLHRSRRSRGGTILGVGFLLWSLHFAALPFLDNRLPAIAGAHMALAIAALLITVGIVMEEERAMSDHRYRTLFESSADAIFLLDPEMLQVLEANRAAQQLAARDLPGLTGLHFRELCPDLCSKDVEREGVAALLQLTRRRDGEFHIVRPDGNSVLCEGETHVVPSSSGAVVQVIARDLSERRRWLNELNVKSAAIEAAASAIVIGDRDGCIIWANPAFTRLTGYSLAEARGHHIWFLMSTNHEAKLYKELWDTVVLGQPWRGKIANRRKDGTEYTEELSLTPVRDPDGQITNFIAIKQDVSDLAALEVLAR